MSADADILDLHERALAELLELGLAAARQVQARLLEAEEAREVCDLSLAFGRASRAVRQTIALQAKLGRERQRRAREDAAEARRAGEARASPRKAQVRAAVERVIWTEADDDEAERLLDDLEDRVAEEALYDDFGHEPVAAHIVRLCQDLGVPVPDYLAGGAAPDARSAPARADGRAGSFDPGAPAARPGAAAGWRSSA